MRALEAALARVDFAAPYVDKLHCLLRERPSREQRKALHCLAGKHVVVRDSRPEAARAGWPFRIAVEQPSEALLEAIAGLGEHAVNYTEIGRDSLSGNAADLSRLSVVWRRVILIRRPHEVRSIFRYVHTWYFARRGSARNFVLYDDRPSKVDGTRCLHSEVRLRGKLTHERLGLATADKLTRDNLQRVYAECVKLADILDRDEVRREIDAWIETLVTGYMARKQRREGAAFDPANAAKIAEAARLNWRVIVSGLLFNSVRPEFASVADWGRAPVTNLLAHFPDLVRHRLLYFDAIIA